MRRGCREAREEVVGARGRRQARGGMEDVRERLGESDETAGAEFEAVRSRTNPGASHADSASSPLSSATLSLSPSLSLSLFPPPPSPLRPSSSAWVRPALKLASPCLTVTQLRGHPAVGSQASTSLSPQSRALKTTLHLLARPPVPYFLRAPTYRGIQLFVKRVGEAGSQARLAFSHCDSHPGVSRG